MIQTVPLKGDAEKLLFFASTPSIPGESFECHACAPLLSTMVVTEGPSGLATKLPLQAIGPAGKWGQIPITDTHTPSIVQVAPGKLGFIVLHSDSGQGNTENWASIHSIEVDGFRTLGGFHVHDDSRGSGPCAEEGRCPEKDTSVRFLKKQLSNGYYDLAATEIGVEFSEGAAHRYKSTYVLRYDGTKYAALEPRTVVELPAEEKPIAAPSFDSPASAGVGANAAEGARRQEWSDKR